MTQYGTPAGGLNNSKDEFELGALMRLAQQGDGTAYSELLTRIKNMLAKTVGKSVHENSRDDVLQDIILAIHSKRHTYNSEQFFLPWLYAIAKYKIIDHLRSKSRRELLPFDNKIFEELPAPESVIAESSLPEQKIGEMLFRLPQLEREMIQKVKIEGASIKEAADKFNLTESNVKIHIHRGVKRLKKIFSGSDL